MPEYVPHTPDDLAKMLERIGVSSIDDLFSQIPSALQHPDALELPEGLSEWEALEHTSGLAAANLNASTAPCFHGAGIYHHYTPSVVPAIMSRGEFLTSYTPYQPERSQGMLQTIYEFQSMTCRLMGFDASNASMYDGATALAEGILMASAVTGRRRVLLSETIHPHWRDVCRTYMQGHNLTLETVPHTSGRITEHALRDCFDETVAAFVMAQPNFFGLLEDVQALTGIAKAAGAMTIGCVNPIAMALLPPPGQWPADIAVAEGQALGLPMNFGGPLLGLLACRKEFVRQLPGRIVGATVDADGRRAYTLTLQTREQHIRREKASSNICTNEALYALGATVYLSQMGRNGLRRVSEMCVQRTHEAFEAVTSVRGFTPLFEGPFFHEFAVRTPLPVNELNAKLADEGIIGPHDLSSEYPELGNTALFCCTELTSREHIARMVRVLESLA